MWECNGFITRVTWGFEKNINIHQTRPNISSHPDITQVASSYEPIKPADLYIEKLPGWKKCRRAVNKTRNCPQVKSASASERKNDAMKISVVICSRAAIKILKAYLQPRGERHWKMLSRVELSRAPRFFPLVHPAPGLPANCVILRASVLRR